MNNPLFTGDGRYALGMSFAIEEIVPEMMQSFKDMADPEVIKASLYCDRLRDAMKGCRSPQQCREGLTEELRRLAREIATEGTHLNKLVTRTE
ncbi:hypothetical protein OV287_54830 [Archangium sp. miwbw1]|uniref:Uncharacterized protein n=1 Tax=Archangium lansingense TaxID=2995310 RepID=A0ABT4APE1_9BACT|nr:hypothetical protein [Archangium lansinium]MCY1083548.1 hypothetical protein [Archangium lansinium]